MGSEARDDEMHGVGASDLDAQMWNTQMSELFLEKGVELYLPEDE